MFTFIIIITVVIFIVATMWSMSAYNRAAFAVSAWNATKWTAGATYIVSKGTVTGTWRAGNLTAGAIDESGEDMVQYLNNFNKHMEAKAGATKVGAQAGKSALSAVGHSAFMKATERKAAGNAKITELKDSGLVTLTLIKAVRALVADDKVTDQQFRDALRKLS